VYAFGCMFASKPRGGAVEPRRERETERQRETERDRERQRETERDRESKKKTYECVCYNTL